MRSRSGAKGAEVAALAAGAAPSLAEALAETAALAPGALEVPAATALAEGGGWAEQATHARLPARRSGAGRVRFGIRATVSAMLTRRAWFLVHPEGIVVRSDPARPAAVTLPDDSDAAALGLLVDGAPVAATTHPLGELPDGTLAVAAAVTSVPEGLRATHLRGLWGSLGDASFLMAGRAVQVVEWADTHRFCGRCATPMERVPTERCMRCPRCGLLGYPRIAPAVIVLVRRGEEALLARGARFPGVFYSTLAGFVEIGESLEDTIAREIREEVGIEVKGIRYFGSQPWPFPHSLMVGYFAEWASGDLHPDGSEILDARWYRATDLPPIPPPLSIARRLIDAWVADVTRA
jgi:NAD+ diphosphatase